MHVGPPWGRTGAKELTILGAQSTYLNRNDIAAFSFLALCSTCSRLAEYGCRLCI